MNVAIIGYGSMGKKHHSVLQMIDNINICAIVDPELDTEAEEYYFNNVSEALDCVSVDFAVVATPTKFHCKTACELLQCGIHVLIEKPIAINLQEASIISEVARANKCKVAVGHIERFNPAIVCLMEELKNQKVLNCSIKRISPYPSRINDVGVKLDLSIHDVDLIKYLTQQEIIDYNTSCSNTKGDREDTAAFYFELSKGATAIALTSWLGPFRERKIEVLTDNFYYVADLLNHRVAKYCSTGYNTYTTTDLIVHKANALLEQTIDFINLIESGTSDSIASAQAASDSLRYVL